MILGCICSAFVSDGTGSSDWGSGGPQLGPSGYATYNPSMMPSHLSQSYSLQQQPPNSNNSGGGGCGPGGMVHLPPSHDSMASHGGYPSHSGLPPNSNTDSPLLPSSLPPMSTFRAPPGSGSGPSSSAPNHTTSPLYNNHHSPGIVPQPPSGQPGDTVAKALASVSTQINYLTVWMDIK